jgi:hypothetical protein
MSKRKYHYNQGPEGCFITTVGCFCLMGLFGIPFLIILALIKFVFGG